MIVSSITGRRPGLWLAALYSIFGLAFIPGTARANIFGEPSTETRLFANFLEIYAADAGSSSGESASSLLNSVRSTSSIYSFQVVEYDEVANQRTEPLSPGFRYRRSFDEGSFFLGINYAQSANNDFRRTILGNDNSVFRDEARTVEQTNGYTIGIGPMDYTTQEGSGEFYFTYSTIQSSGPFQQTQLKYPSFLTAARLAAEPTNSEAALDNYQLLGYSTGQLKFNVRSYALGGGYTGVLNDYLNLYFSGEMEYITGKLQLATLSLGSVSPAIAGASSSSLPNPNFFSYLDGRVDGFLIKLETGLVMKLWQGIGLRVAYFGQVPFLDFEVENSFDTFRTGSNDPFSTRLTDPQPTSVSDRQLFIHGLSFAFVANF
jgi:hypothetical protein